jgi:hypothetical protein
MIETEALERVREQLSSRAELFEDPRTYLDGVEDALDSLQALDEAGDDGAASDRDLVDLVHEEARAGRG